MSQWFSLETDHILFKCPCGYIDCNAPLPSQNLLDTLDKIRDFYKSAILINSGPRCKKHNQFVGGMQDSEHLTGNGADLVCLTSSTRWKLLDAILYCNVTRIGIGKNFLHVGVDATKDSHVIWTYYN